MENSLAPAETGFVPFLKGSGMLVEAGGDFFAPKTCVGWKEANPANKQNKSAKNCLLYIYLKILTPKNQMDRKEFQIGLLHHQLDKARLINQN